MPPGPSEGSEGRRQLEQLQEELQALKSRWGRALRLQRATPAEAPATAPFPIVLTFQVDPPHAAAAHYDVSTVRIQLRLSRAALQLPQYASTGGGGGGGEGGGTVTHGSPLPRALPAGTDLLILSEELPRMLQAKIAEQLTRVWLNALGTPPWGAAAAGGVGPGGGGGNSALPSGPYKLSVPASYMQERFVPLICLIPELVEPYQAEDEHGATVRRYAIVNNDVDACGTGSGGEAPVVAAGVSGSTGRAAEPSGSPLSVAPAPSSQPAKPTQATAEPSAGLPAASAAPAAPAVAAEGTATATATAKSAPTGEGSSRRGDEGAAGPPAGPRAHSSTDTQTHGSATLIAQQPEPRPGPAAGPRAEAPTPAQQQPGPANSTQRIGGAAVRPVAATAAAIINHDVSVSGINRGTGLPETGLSDRARTHAQRTVPEPSDEPPTFAATAAAAAEPAPAAGAALSETVSAPAAAAALRTADAAAAESSRPSTQRVPPPQPTPPPGLLSYTVALKELQYIQKRYSQVFSARVHREGGPAGGTGGAGGSHSSQGLVQPGCLTTFELELLPTDPDWDMPPVRLVGQLMPVSASAYLPSLGVALSSRLPPWLRAALETHMAQQLTVQAAEAEEEMKAVAAARAAADADAAATSAAPAPASAAPPPPPRGAAAGRGDGVRGSSGRGGGRGLRGSTGAAAEQETETALEGTVLLPLGALRNLFRDLENYAGAVARAADEERRRLERDAAAAGGGGGSGNVDGDGDEEGGGGSRYDDDGYGDGSHRHGDGGAESDEYDNDDDDGSGGSNDDGTAADEVRFSGAAAEAGGSEPPAAYAVILEGLQLDNLAAVEVLRAHFEVACGRCGARDTAVVASAAVAGGGGGGASHQASASGQCQRCTTPWSLVMRPHFVHATSNSLCVIKPEGCRPMDLLPSLMAGQCAECSAVMSLRDVQVGLPFSRTCSSCHKELSVSVAAVSFVPRGPPRGGGGGAAAAARVASRAAASRRARADAGGGGGAGGLRPGQPLPALGTCKHYRHSYRWLRFPCCGMRFACDLCHEEAVPDGHAVRWAQRMVCGFCSTEQPLALACRACGRQLAGSSANPSGRRTRFWEGGTGCRDPRRLNKNDPHKWRGRNKTVSAKQSRVGPKPWSGKAGGGAGAGSSSG